MKASVSESDEMERVKPLDAGEWEMYPDELKAGHDQRPVDKSSHYPPRLTIDIIIEFTTVHTMLLEGNGHTRVMAARDDVTPSLKTIGRECSGSGLGLDRR